MKFKKRSLATVKRETGNVVIWPVPDGPVLSFLEGGSALSLDPLDVVSSALRNPVQSPERSAAGTFLASILWKEDTRSSILADPNLVRHLDAIRSVGDVMNFFSQLPPSFVSKVMKVISSAGNKKNF